MNTTIFTVTYDKDLEFLKYNIKSIRKFCKNYYSHVIVIDDHKDDCKHTKQYLESIGQPFHIDLDAKYIKNGYVRQQFIKLFADKYVPQGTDYICHVDSDSIFLKEHTPEIFFKNNKPILMKEKYEKILCKPPSRTLEQQQRLEIGMKRWKDVVAKYTKIEPEYEYMRKMPFVYSIETHKNVRIYLEKTNNSTLLDLLKDTETLSEYNIIGAICDKYYNDNYEWVDETNYVQFRDWHREQMLVYKQYTNRVGTLQQYIDLNDKSNPISLLLD